MKEKSSTLSPRLLEKLACPKCRGTLEYRESDLQLVCAQCKLAYVIREGVPVLLIDEAIKLL